MGGWSKNKSAFEVRTLTFYLYYNFTVLSELQDSQEEAETNYIVHVRKLDDTVVKIHGKFIQW